MKTSHRMKARNIEQPKTGLHSLSGLDGIIKAWQHRGKIHLIVEAASEEHIKQMIQGTLIITRRTRDKVQMVTEWTDPHAKAQQTEAELAKSKLVRQEAKAFKRNTALQLSWDSTFTDPVFEDLLHILKITEEEREAMEDELDNYPATSLQVPAGYLGFQYKEDLDLERAGKSERDLQADRNAQKSWLKAAANKLRNRHNPT